jgi:hypothetical protein
MVRPEPDGGGGTIKVTPEDVALAAKTFYQAQSDLSNAWETLQSALDANGGMAGDDQPANEFNAKYAPAVTEVWRGLRAACLKLGGISMGLTTTANNFVRAEHHSTVGKNKGAATTFPTEPVFSDIAMADPNSAIGPGGGSWLPGPLKKFWPDADTGKLRSAASAWRAAAQSIDTTSWEAQGAIDSISTGDDTAQAITQFWGQTFTPGDQRTLLAGLEAVCNALGDACDKYAQAVDDAHSKMKDALAATGIVVGITTIIGILATPFTLGGSDAAAGAADTAEAAGILGPILSALIITVSDMIGTVLPDEVLAMLSFGIEEAPDIEVVEAETTEIEGAIDDELASADGTTPEDLGLDGDYTSPSPGTPEYQTRIDELAKDPAHSGAVSPQSTQEARVGLQAEANGDIPGPIQRAPFGPNGEDQGEFTDANGQNWDVKSSPDQRPSYRPNPGQSIPNPQTPQQFTDMINEELANGQNVLLDPDGMTAGRLAQMEQLVNDNPAWQGKVIWSK